MKSHFAFPFAAALAVIATAAPATAAMPVAGVTAISAGDAIVHVAQKKKPRKSEVDRSVDNGTVPARYRSRVPKEYQQYVPFEKGR